MTTGERTDPPLRLALIVIEVLIAYALVGLVAGFWGLGLGGLRTALLHQDEQVLATGAEPRDAVVALVHA